MRVSTEGGAVRRARRRAESRAAIVQAGRDVLLEGGYGRLAMREVAGRAGIAPGTLYLHFADRAALVSAIIQEDFAALADRVRAVRAADPTVRLKRIGDAYFAYAAESTARYRLLFMTPDLPNPQGEPDAAVPGDLERDGYALFANAVRAHLEAVTGAAPRAARVHAAAQLYWSGLHGVVALRLSSLQETWVPWQPRRRIERRMIELLVDGLALHP